MTIVSAELVVHQTRMLFVSDNQLFRRLMLPSLQDQGFHVTAARSATAALQLRRLAPHFDLLMVDLAIPDMDAFAFARTVLAGGAWAELPLVAISVCPDPRRRRAELAAGYVRHVSVFAESLLASS